MGIGLIGKAAGDQRTYRLTNQSPVVLVSGSIPEGRGKVKTANCRPIPIWPTNNLHAWGFSCLGWETQDLRPESPAVLVVYRVSAGMLNSKVVS
jgi:hypothetical protein